MISEKFPLIRYAFTALFICFISIFGNGQSNDISIRANSEMEAVKASLEQPGGVTPELIKRRNSLSEILNKCSDFSKLINSLGKDEFAPENLICFSGQSISAGDPTMQRFQVASTGNGIVAGCPASANSPHYDVFYFNLSGCAAFPSVVTVTMCGTGGCAPPANTDGIVVLYRTVAAGDAFTADGLPGAFNPANACTNAIAADDDLSGAFVATGGASCNQLNTADCLATCGSSSTGGLKRSLGRGRFTVVVEGFLATDLGNYSLTVDAPGAGCSLQFAPSAANGIISGRVTTSNGQGIARTRVTVAGGTSGSFTAITNAFGYYSVSDLETGQTYVVSVAAKGVTFAEPVRVISLTDELASVDFMTIE